MLRTNQRADQESKSARKSDEDRDSVQDTERAT